MEQMRFVLMNKILKLKVFYEHLGFHVYKRSEYDEQGNPYPLVYMKLDINGNDLLNQY